MSFNQIKGMKIINISSSSSSNVRIRHTFDDMHGCFCLYFLMMVNQLCFVCMHVIPESCGVTRDGVCVFVCVSFMCAVLIEEKMKLYKTGATFSFPFFSFIFDDDDDHHYYKFVCVSSSVVIDCEIIRSFRKLY